MKNSFAMAALAAGIGMGGFGVHALQAQTKPPVYMIEDNTVNEPEGFAKDSLPWLATASRCMGVVTSGAAAGFRSMVIRRRDASFLSGGTRSIKC